MFLKNAIVTLLSVLLLSSSVAFAQTPNDMDKTSDFAKSAVTSLMEKNILQGDDNGNINPQKTITRAEIVTLLVRALNINTYNIPDTATFKDVPKDCWAYKYVEAAYRDGIVKGVDADRFGLNDPCTREQMAALFIRALKQTGLNAGTDCENINALSDKLDISAWAKQEVELALKTGLMNGTGTNTFNPQGSALREQAAVVIQRFLDNSDSLQSTVSVVFNGDVMPLSHPAIVEGHAVLIPVDFFKNYFANSLTGNPEEGIVCLELAWGYNDLGYLQNYLWFRAGETTAYKSSMFNIDPFETPEAYTDRAIALDTAPVLRNGVLYLPLEDICSIVKARYEYNQAENTVSVEADEKAAYPNLQYALGRNLNNPYWGDAVISGNMYQTISGGEAQPDEQIQIGYDLFRRINSLASQTNLSYTIVKGGAAPEILTYKEISAPSFGIDFVENSKESAWLTTNRDYLYKVSKLTGLNPLVKETDVYNVKTNQMLFSNYSNLPITREGTVDIDGREAVKYVMHFDQDSILLVMDKSNFYGTNLNVIKLSFNQEVSYDIVLYVTGEDIVRQEYHFSGQGREEIPSDQINVGMDLTIDYQNAGQQMQITLPDGRAIPSA
ncbi:hypothetical protein SDC9_47554 [bioreactor metagenome]|uniref:SLH domain-containing protein n=1 Tax=bioreactor metagenome TaxID=1076179 RepID=A0A644WG78_9ZZZZ